MQRELLISGHDWMFVAAARAKAKTVTRKAAIG